MDFSLDSLSIYQLHNYWCLVFVAMMVMKERGVTTGLQHNFPIQNLGSIMKKLFNKTVKLFDDK